MGIKNKLKRGSVLGEFAVLKEYADNYGILFDFKTVQEYEKVASRPCEFCGGKTPGYSVNTLMTINFSEGFTEKNVMVACWPCKRLIYSVHEAEERIGRMRKIINFLDKQR